MNIFSLSLFSYAVPFLTLYPGVRQTGMGGAFVAIADEAWANFYNPAGLAFQGESNFGFEYTPVPTFLSSDAYYWNIAGVLPLGKVFSIGSFGAGEIWEFEGVYAPELPPPHFTHDYTIGLSFSYKLRGFLGTGISLKYPFIIGKLGVGVALQNIGPEINYYTLEWLSFSFQKEPLPLIMKGGISYSLSFNEIFKSDGKQRIKQLLFEKFRLSIAWEICKVVPEDQYDENKNPWHSLGIEIRPISFIVARIGYFYEPGEFSRKGWTKGVGIDLKFLPLDISGDSVFYYDKPHRFRFSLSLYPSKTIFLEKGLMDR